MRQPRTNATPLAIVSRRRFLEGVAVAGIVAGIDSTFPAYGSEGVQQTPTILGGKCFSLDIETKAVNLTGRNARATLVNGLLPGPTLRWREGDVVSIAVTNRLKVPTSIHWHGIRLPSEMDGVPGLSFAGIAPGDTFVYRIPVRQSGTYWYHSHSGGQEQTGVSGALLVEPKDGELIKFDREYVVFLTDWTDASPDAVFENLKEDSEYYNTGQRTAGTFLKDAKKDGLRSTISMRRMWGRMNMTPTDISDVTGFTYSYLLNGKGPSENWTGLFKDGERVRLRFINGSSMTFFDVRIPGLFMTVVQADGNDVEPVSVEEFRIANAETYDVIVEPRGDSAYTIFAQAFDRSGYARGTLAPAIGISAAVPRLDSRPLRTMVDMGMAISGIKMGPMNMSHSGPSLNPSAESGLDDPDMEAGEPAMDGMKGHSTMSRLPTIADSEAAYPENKPASSTLTNPNAYTMPLSQPGPTTIPIGGTSTLKTPVARAVRKPLHVGPQIDGLSMAVTERLSDPGDGLEGNGRRVLTYSDLRARYRGVDSRPPTREIELHLTGNMQRYIWGFDGEKFTDAAPIELKLGERVRFTFINDSMMDHPIHLHGMWSELEAGHAGFNPYKHTIIVKPSERVSYLVTADTVGHWALHCHLMFHMRAGMFRTVVVS
jgi:CopA family copper-resistance protein